MIHNHMPRQSFTGKHEQQEKRGQKAQDVGMFCVATYGKVKTSSSHVKQNADSSNQITDTQPVS